VSLTVGSLFSGIGGLDLGVERAGMTVRWQCEIDPYCCRVLAKHWPHVPNLGDVKTIDWSTVERVDLVCGGFPCQPVSDAGLKRAQDDERWLWPWMRDAIDAVRPEWVVIENVPGLRKRGLGIVRSDLHAMEYRSRPVSLSACQLGAPHTRSRLFTVAHTAGEGCRSGRAQRRGEGQAAGEQQDRSQPPGRAWWSHEPDVARMAYGVPRGMDRRRALGNAVVPQVAEWIGRRIMEAAA
jgi:DNA (cytosine-5)-methyltransferase 1